MTFDIEDADIEETRILNDKTSISKYIDRAVLSFDIEAVFDILPFVCH